jgi:4-hydroxy-tetrahydrodipicolinate synthase
MTATTELSGVIPPILTPTDSHDRVDEPGLRASVRRMIDAGVHGLFVGGSAGEGPLLAEREWRRLMEIVQDEAAGRLPLLAGVQDTSTRKVVDKIVRLRELGYRYCVVTPTFYIPTRTGDEHLRLFAACHEAAGDMEVIGYNIPQMTQSHVAVETFCEAARRGWIRHCKESSGDLTYLRRLVIEGRKVGLRVLMGDERTAAEGLLAGAVGLVNLCVNVEPATYLQLFDAAVRRDSAELTRLQERINRIVEEVVLTGPCFVAGPKYVLSTLGIGRGTPLAPLQPVSDEQARRIDRFLKTQPAPAPATLAAR